MSVGIFKTLLKIAGYVPMNLHGTSRNDTPTGLLGV